MSGIKFTSFYNREQNPTVNFIPFNAGGSFVDSPLATDGDTTLYSQTISGNVVGIDLNADSREYYFGDKDNKIGIGTGLSGIYFRGLGITAATAGGFATHLIVSINGNDRKIKLLSI